VTRPVLGAGELVLRPPVDGDVAALVEVLTDPEVATWWGRWDAARVHADLLAGGNGWVVERGGSVVGWLEVNVESEPYYEHVGLDIAIGATGRGCGLGRQALRLVVRHFRDQGCHRFTIDPAADNGRAVHAYAALGFRPVGLMRAYERRADGRWHDNLLMDLLADELVEP